jgi:hypothetical protein
LPLKGHVDNGVIILDEPARLPNGMHVLVQPQIHKKRDITGIAGSWEDERTADEIIRDIHQARRSKR